jgi:WD40 repeat protein
VPGLPGYLRLWDADGKELALVRDAEALLCVAFAPDGKHLVTGDAAGNVALRDAASGKVLRRVGRHCSAVKAVAFSGDGKLLATGGKDTAARLWDVGTWQERAALLGSSGTVTAVAFTRDGNTLVTRGDDTAVRLWDVKSTRQRATLGDKNSTLGLLAVAVAPDGKTLATVWANAGITLWSAETGKQVAQIGGAPGKGEPPPPPDPDDPDSPFPQRYSSDNYTAVAFSADGKTIAARNVSGEVALWDVAARKRTAVLGTQAPNYYGGGTTFTTVGQAIGGQSRQDPAPTFSPDGKRLATPDGGTVKIFDPAAKKQVSTLTAVPSAPAPAPSSGVRALAYTADGKSLVVALDDRTVSVRDRRTGEESLRLRGHEDTVTCLAVGRDGRTLVTGSADRTAKVWDLTTGKERRTLRGHTKWVYAVAISPDGKLIASGGYDRQVKLWDATTGNEVGGRDGHKAAVRALVFSPDSKTLASGGMDRTVKVWDVAGRKERATLKAEEVGIRGLAFRRDGKILVAVGENNVATAWDMSALSKPLGKATVAVSELHALAAAPGGDTFTLAGLNGGPWAWRPGKGDARQIPITSPQGGEITAAAYSPDGMQFATGGADGSIVLHYATPAPLRLFQGHAAPVRWAVFSPDGRHVLTAAGTEKAPDGLRLWDRATGKEMRRFPAEKHEVTAAAVSPAGARCAAAHSDGSVTLWDVASGKLLKTFAGGMPATRCVAFGPDGVIATAREDGLVRLWHAEAGKASAPFKERCKDVRAMAFSPDGRQILTAGGDRAVRILTAGGVLSRQIDCGEPVQSAVWADGGKQVLCAAGSKVLLYEAATGRLVRTLTGHLGRVEQVVLTPDGKTAISAGQDLNIILWDLATGAELTRLDSAFTQPVAAAPPGMMPGTPGGMPVLPSPPPPDGKIEDKPAAKSEEGKSEQRPTPPPTTQPVPGDPSKGPSAGPPSPPATWVLYLSVSPDGRHLLTAGGPTGAFVSGATGPQGLAPRLWDLRIVRDVVRAPAIRPAPVATPPVYAVPAPPPEAEPPPAEAKDSK